VGFTAGSGDDAVPCVNRRACHDDKLLFVQLVGWLQAEIEESLLRANVHIVERSLGVIASSALLKTQVVKRRIHCC
jgi:hypothetical protein